MKKSFYCYTIYPKKIDNLLVFSILALCISSFVIVSMPPIKDDYKICNVNTVSSYKHIYWVANKS